ncbi:MAG: Wzz/FepE/Etk N-terminal domain-containing protein [Acutalibacteraceae bacterium]|nr:Wzz/FepE/Etk N-terminal domain-containing protein [Acutalibacteraceae bacterium]
MEINIFELINLLIRRLWILVLSALLCSGLAFCYSFFGLTPLYTSTATIYINNSTVSNYENKISSSDISAAESLVNNVATIVESRSVRNLVYEDLGRTKTQEELKNMLSVEVKTNTVMVELSVQCDNAEDAQKIAESYVKCAKTRIMEIIENSGVSVVDEPNLPKKTSFPNYNTYIILGFLAGLVISAVAVVVVDILDTRIDSAQDFEETFPDISIIGIIPNIEEM